MADFTVDMTRLETLQEETPQIALEPHQDPSVSQLYESLQLPTPERSIRLLHLDTNRSFDAPLTGKLYVVSLKCSPNFTALSYVWGTSTSPSDTITCNDISVNISTNCRDALREIRWQNEARVGIWVDAICINQANMAERSSQILLMGEVYSWASHVYVWLGKSNAMSDEAFACLNRASRLRMALIGVPAVSKPNRATSIMKVVFKLANATWNPVRVRDRYLSQKYVWEHYQPECLDEILSRTWISRSWTFQEIILAQAPVLLCGHQRLTWDNFLAGLEYIRKPQPNDRRRTIDESFELPKSYSKWKNLVDIWMHVGRKTSWNGSQVRRLGGLEKEVSIAFYAATFASIYTKVDSHPSLKIYIVTMMPIAFASTVVSNTWGYFVEGFVIIGLIMALRRFRKFWHPDYIGPMLSSISDPSDTLITITIGILQALYERYASDPRDRAYALHGVLETLGVTLTPADYEKPSGHVYHDLYSDFLNWSPILINLLMDAGENPDRFDKPTWVPNWETAMRDSWFHLAYRYTPKVVPGATPNSTPQIRVLGAELHVEAQLRATVTFCSGPFEMIISRSGATENETQENHISQETTITEENTMTREDTIIQERSISQEATITQDDTIIQVDSITQDDTPVNRIDQGTAKKMITIMLRWLLVLREKAPLTPAYDIGRRAAFDILEGFSQHSKSEDSQGFERFFILFLEIWRLQAGDAINFDAAATDMLNRLELDRTALEYFAQTCERLAEERSLFALESGHVGTGPLGMKEGDMMALIPGVGVPMVLRVTSQSLDYWNVIGPAVVHGMMDGEEFDETQLEKIVLV